jgi:hypothetical protein
MAILLIFLTLMFFLPLNSSEAAVDLGISIGDEGLRGFYLAVGDYYRVAEREVIIVKGRHIPDEEIPVVFFIAQRAHVRPATIIDLRLRGKTWMDITLHFGLSPEIFYVPVRKAVVTGPPYGKAYGYYKKKPRKEWRRIVLDDDDVINLVNLRFISNHYSYEPEKVIKMREGSKNFIVINEEVAKEKKGGKEKIKEKGENGKEKYKGNGKGKGKKD